MKNIHPAFLRLYDYFAQALIGMACAALPALLPDNWPMIILMMLGMAIAIPIFLILANFLAALAGGFEILMPGMQTAMLAGMAGPMLQGTLYEAMAAGGVIGLLLQLLFHVYDKSVHGEVTLEKEHG